MVGLCVEDAQVEACSAVSFLEMVEGRVKLSLVCNNYGRTAISTVFSFYWVQGAGRAARCAAPAPSTKLPALSDAVPKPLLRCPPHVARHCLQGLVRSRGRTTARGQPHCLSCLRPTQCKGIWAEAVAAAEAELRAISVRGPAPAQVM